MIDRIGCDGIVTRRGPKTRNKRGPITDVTLSMPSPQPPPLFPPQTSSYILSFQFSSWYPHFSDHSIKSTIIRPLAQEFRDYLDADGVFVPEGSEDVLVTTLYARSSAHDLPMPGPLKARFLMAKRAMKMKIVRPSLSRSQNWTPGFGSV